MVAVGSCDRPRIGCVTSSSPMPRRTSSIVSGDGRCTSRLPPCSTNAPKFRSQLVPNRPARRGRSPASSRTDRARSRSAVRSSKRSPSLRSDSRYAASPPSTAVFRDRRAVVVQVLEQIAQDHAGRRLGGGFLDQLQLAMHDAAASQRSLQQRRMGDARVGAGDDDRHGRTRRRVAATRDRPPCGRLARTSDRPRSSPFNAGWLGRSGKVIVDCCGVGFQIEQAFRIRVLPQHQHPASASDKIHDGAALRIDAADDRASYVRPSSVYRRRSRGHRSRRPDFLQ